MAKWDIDRSLRELEPEDAPGTTIQRVLLDVKLLTNGDPAYLRRYGNGRIKPTAKETARGAVCAWSIGIGVSGMRKAFFYDRTIRGVYLQARRAAKLDRIADGAEDWLLGPMDLKLPERKTKPRRKRAKKRADGEARTG